MKKLNLFLLVAGFFVFSSCTERLENQDVQQKAGNVIIKINDSSSSARFISPVQSFDISQVKKWTLTFTPITPVGLKEKQFTLEKGQNSVTLGVGTYSLYIEGSYEISNANGGSSIVKLSGTRTNITVTEGKTTQVAVAVGLKKTAEGTGTFAIGFKFNVDNWYDYYNTYGNYIGNSQTIDYTQGIKILLISKDDNKTVYSTEDDDYLKIQSVDEKDNTWIINVSNKELIPAGYYYIEFYAYYSKKENSDQDIKPGWRKVVLNTDNLVEIADDQETIGDFADLNFPNTVTEYVYYASKTGSTELNGLSQKNPGNLYTILENIYANKAVSIATINYKYPDSDKMEFDVSKVQRGKQVTIYYQKDGPGDSSSFTIDEEGLTTFNAMNEELSLITTNDKVKSFKVKDLSGKVCLNNGVYLDFSSFEGNEQSNIYFDVDDVEYYKKNPMGISKTELDIKISFTPGDFSEYQEQMPPTVFTYEFSVKQNVEGLYELYAQEPSPVHIYYGNSSSSTVYEIGIGSNQILDYASSIASWCDDGNGGIYIFKATTNYQDSYYPLVTSPSYEIFHYKKIESGTGTSFILKKEKIAYSVNNVPVSMCTDGSSIYYVESVLDISTKGGDKLDLGSWGAWAHKDCKVKYFSINDPSVKELDFSGIFTNGKVTSVYYYNNELYVAGYKKEYIGSITDSNAGKTEFFDSTYSVYKLSNPKDVSTAILVSDVFKNSTENSRVTRLLDNYDATKDRIKSYNAITDMAIMDGKLYALENSYYYASATSYIAKGSLRQISLKNGELLNTFDRSNKDSSGKDSFNVPNKILAVLPKKLELVIADSAKDNDYNGASYRVDLSGNTANITEEFVGSGYYFDKYPKGSAFFNTAFNENAYYTSKASSEEFNN